MALKVHSLNSWLPEAGFPMVVGGPCSAESEEQLIRTARELSTIPQVRIFRAGIWKPRTRPDGFQGVGEIGLSWMKHVKQETGLLTTVEVANPQHINSALKAGIDVLWIGARTVVNPFSVQEICDVLQGVDIPVMVKNPINPDIHLWVGALERLNHAGIQKLIAIHRGFYYYQKGPYRNSPMWEIPIELMRQFPSLTVLCDPSHIAGNREWVASICQKALDLEMDGFMIEVHPQPHHALTDAEQQITPASLKQLLAKLVYRHIKGNKEFQSKLAELRNEIDKIDWALLDILAQRMRIVDEIGAFKKEKNITILQIKRWRSIIKSRLENGNDLGLSREFLMDLLELVHRESIQRQMDIMEHPGKRSK